MFHTSLSSKMKFAGKWFNPLFWNVRQTISLKKTSLIRERKIRRGVSEANKQTKKMSNKWIILCSPIIHGQKRCNYSQVIVTLSRKFCKIGINEDLWRSGLLLCNMQLASSKTQTFYCVIEIVKFASWYAKTKDL